MLAYANSLKQGFFLGKIIDPSYIADQKSEDFCCKEGKNRWQSDKLSGN